MSNSIDLKVTVGMNKDDSLLENMVSRIEERQYDLIDRRRNLKNKVTTMERFIPALMAYNIWMTDKNYTDASYCKVQEIMEKFSLQSNPADRLLVELRSRVNDLHQETTQLHDKIIDADMKLEETGMELESLELANKEMEEKLIELRNEMQKYDISGLYSIHSDDLVCLKKIRQLAEEELTLKNCIKNLENKENMYTEQINQLFSCKEFKCGKRKMENVQESGKSNRKLYYHLKHHKYNMHLQKRKFTLDKHKEQRTCCNMCPTLNMMNGYQETSKKLSRKEKLCPFLYRIPLNNNTSRKDTMRSCSYTKIQSFKVADKQMSATSLKTKCPCLAIPLYESPMNAVSKISFTQSLKQLKQSSVPCDFGISCNECKSFAACKEICDYNSEENSTEELLDIPCDCIISSCPIKENYQLTASETPPEAYDSNSEEQLCKCCFCT